MSEHAGEKTEQATPRKLEESWKKGQFARSSEVQTVTVVLASVFALLFTMPETWGRLVGALTSVLSHLHDTPLTTNSLPGYAAASAMLFGQCVWPVALAAVLAGLLAGGVQSRFQTASEALTANWDRLNPVQGFQRLFSTRSTTATALSMVKMIAIIALSYGEVRAILNDPIFSTSVNAARVAEFMGNSALRIVLRIGLILMIIAAVDYAYQFWKTNQDLMMTKQEVKEEAKSSDGNPEVKAQQRRRRQRAGQRKMLMEVPKADVIITNPTHLAIALRYDRKTMKAPKIVAKGSRLNALRIREIAKQHQVPIIENKPLARLMFKYGKVGGEVPAQLYSAVAEVLAWVYRVNRYRYYAAGNQV
jgi:flagellar biosynthetic protein FlhB